MLTEVKDHLTGEMVPVRYIEPGKETLNDCLSAIEAIARSAGAASAEIDLACTRDDFSLADAMDLYESEMEALRIEALALADVRRSVANA